MKLEKTGKAYQSLIEQISNAYLEGQRKAVAVVNSFLVETYWQIGRYIVEFEQGGEAKAEYGKNLLPKLSRDLSSTHGRGFSLSNIYQMRLFFVRYPKFQTAYGKFKSLSWSHFCELISIDDELERQFYESQCLLDNWSVRELKRQKKSSLFLRLAASKDKDGILKLAQKGQVIENPADIIRDPYVLEFLKIP